MELSWFPEINIVCDGGFPQLSPLWIPLKHALNAMKKKIIIIFI